MGNTGTQATGQRLLTIRTAHGWSQRRMAAHLGCTWRMVGKMESDGAKPGRTLANRIQHLLGIPTTAWDDPADLLPQDGSADAAA